MFCYAQHKLMPKKLSYCFFMVLIIHAYLVTMLAILHESYNLCYDHSYNFKEIIGKGYRRRII